VGVLSPPARTFGAAILASGGLLASALADQQLTATELLSVVTTSIGAIFAGLTLSWFAWRRRIAVRRLRRRTARTQEFVARRTAESRTDALTGHGNRRAFDDDLRAWLARGDGRSVGLIFADADGLKDVNDRYGHEAGDRMLRAVANAFAGALRANEEVYRIGGDEFVAIVDGADLDGVAVRLGGHIGVDVDGIGPCSASVGTITGRPGEFADDLVRRADQAMYHAKRERRSETVGPRLTA
jgi:diguanylate cyclase (GGDEF)-like protein